MKNSQIKLHVIHFLDAIYCGQLNSSYQKSGFGIQQTNDFDTYMGYWKNNKIQGLGLVILSNGTTIYAYFIRDQVDGLTIVDNGDILKCGVFRNRQIVGVGFQYNYNNKIWKMNKYHKGVSIKTVSSQQSDIANSIPKLINVQQSIYFHLYNYLNKNYFPQLFTSIVMQLSNQQTYFHGYQGEKGSFGPGIVVKNNKVIQAGFYDEGQLDGYGIRRTQTPTHYQFGHYIHGKKDGPFLQRQSQDTYFIYDYNKDIKSSNPSSYTQKQIIKNQKKFNYNSKDFYSSKNTVPFIQFTHMILAGEVRQFQQHKLDQKVVNVNRKKQYYKTNFVTQQTKEKSSLQIMREKANLFNNIITTRKTMKEKQSTSPKLVKKNITEIEEPSDVQDQIATEENPFQWPKSKE